MDSSKVNVLRVEREGDHWIADAKWLPGSPPVGRGEKPWEAVAKLLSYFDFEDSECYKRLIKEPFKVEIDYK